MPKAAKHPEPRWPAMVALLAVGGLRFALPHRLSVGPDWLLLALAGALIVFYLLAREFERFKLCNFLDFLLVALVTVDMAWSLGMLVAAIPGHKGAAPGLLRAATALWITNILVFALWYWRLDAGGPQARELRTAHTEGAFLFPQMTLDQEVRSEQPWNPGFIDYLFLAFNTSTALSPTDSPVLSRWAKVLTMLQSIVSLTAVALLAARGVNIL